MMCKTVFITQIMLLGLLFVSLDTSAAMASEPSYHFLTPITPSELIGFVLIAFEAFIKIFPKCRKFSLISKLMILSDVIEHHRKKVARSKTIYQRRKKDVQKNHSSRS